MRLISNFQDYYDCVLALDEDKTTPFFRKTKNITYKEMCALTQGKPYDISYGRSGLFDAKNIDKYLKMDSFAIVVNNIVYPGTYDLSVIEEKKKTLFYVAH
jgi:hypothetical protein